MSILPKDFRGTIVSAFASSTVFTSLFYAACLGFTSLFYAACLDLQVIDYSNQTVKLSCEGAFVLLYSFIGYKNVQAANKLADSKVII